MWAGKGPSDLPGVSRGDDKNISVHVNILNHSIDWEGASVEVVNGYWKRRTSKAILIGKQNRL